MFIDEKAVGEKQPAKVGTLKLSEAIRAGFPEYERTKLVYVDREMRQCCAIGGAALATGYDGGGDPDEIKSFLMGRFPGVSESLLSSASAKHTIGYTLDEIADWLEAKGY